MRTFIAVSLSCLALAACDGRFSSPGGHPVPHERDTSNGGAGDVTDTGGTVPADSNIPGLDTRPPSDTRDTGDTDAPTSDVPRRIDGWNGGESGPDQCEADYYACDRDDDLEFCDGGTIQVADCEAVCRDAGYSFSTGCGYDESYNGDVCWCDDAAEPPPYEPPPYEPPPASCDVGWSCAGMSLEYCDGSGVDRWDCDAFCQGEGYAYASSCGYDAGVGGDTCICQDDACTGGVDVCLGNDYLETCTNGGSTATVDCWDVCRDAGYDQVAGCGYDAGYGGDACFCENVVCAADELTCSDGSCVANNFMCDGVDDCAGGDDEWGCAATCVEGASWCESGYELTLCDGGEEWVYDCDDFCRDEGFDFSEGCGYDGASGYDACYCAFETCASYEFQCDDGMCLNEAFTCDGIYDCSYGEDEYGCY